LLAVHDEHGACKLPDLVRELGVPGNLEQPDQTTKEVFGELLELLKCHGKTVEKGDRLAFAQEVIADLDAVDLSLLHTTTNIRGVMGTRVAWQHKMLLRESAQG
jgi:hypothetical protein